MIFRRLLKDSVIYGGGGFIGRVILFFVFPIIANALSPRDFGILELITSTTMLLGMVVNCGLNNAVARFYWDEQVTEQIQPALVSSGLLALCFFGFIALLFGIIVWPFVAGYLGQNNAHVSWVAVLSALLLMVLTQGQRYLTDVMRLHFAPAKFLCIAIFSNALIAGLGVIAVILLHWGLTGYLGAQALAALCVLPIALWMVRKDIRLRIDFSWAKQLIQYGYPFIFAGIAYWIFGSTDRWLLASMSSIVETGVYSVAFKFSVIAYFVAMAFGMAWSPVAIKIKRDYPSQYKAVYVQVFCWLLFVMLLISGSLGLFSGEVISVLMSKAYEGSALPLTILCVGVIFQATQQVTAIGISLERKTHLIARVSWMAAIVNVLLNLLLIPHFGAIGSAWATTLSYFVLTGGYLYLTQRLHPLPLPWFRLFALTVLCLIVFIIAFACHQGHIIWLDDLWKVLFMMCVAGVGCWICWQGQKNIQLS